MKKKTSALIALSELTVILDIRAIKEEDSYKVLRGRWLYFFVHIVLPVLWEQTVPLLSARKKNRVCSINQFILCLLALFIFRPGNCFHPTTIIKGTFLFCTWDHPKIGNLIVNEFFKKTICLTLLVCLHAGPTSYAHSLFGPSVAPSEKVASESLSTIFIQMTIYPIFSPGIRDPRWWRERCCRASRKTTAGSA